MKLNKRQFCQAVKSYQSMLEEDSEITDVLDVGATWKPSEWISSYYEFLSEMCELEETPNYGTVLDWFCFDMNFGRNRDNKIFDGGKTWTINSPEILYDYIMEVEN